MQTSFESGAQMMREINTRSVNVEGLEPAVVIAAMLNARRGDGIAVPGRATPDSVKKSFDAYCRTSRKVVNSIWDSNFLSSIGLELRLNADGKTLRTFFYENTYGDGLAEIVIDHIRCSRGDDRWRTDHLINYARPASMLSIVLVLGVIAAFLALVFLL